MPSPQASVRIDNGSKILALMDTRTEINVMDQILHLPASLPMWMDPKLQLVVHLKFLPPQILPNRCLLILIANQISAGSHGPAAAI